MTKGRPAASRTGGARKQGGAKRHAQPAPRPAAPRPAREAAAAERIRELEARLLDLEARLAEARRGAAPAQAPSSAPRRASDAADDEPEIESLEEVRAGETLGDEPEEYEAYDEEPDFLVPDVGPARRRRELDRERADRELDAGDEAFWMVCPKCGDHLSEHEFDGVHVERCEACGGLWIDKGESDLLLSLAADDRALARRARGILQ